MPFDWSHLPTTANQLCIRLHMLELTIGKGRRVTQYMHTVNSCSTCGVSAPGKDNNVTTWYTLLFVIDVVNLLQ